MYAVLVVLIFLKTPANHVAKIYLYAEASFVEISEVGVIPAQMHVLISAQEIIYQTTVQNQLDVVKVYS